MYHGLSQITFFIGLLLGLLACNSNTSGTTDRGSVGSHALTKPRDTTPQRVLAQQPVVLEASASDIQQVPGASERLKAAHFLLAGPEPGTIRRFVYEGDRLIEFDHDPRTEGSQGQLLTWKWSKRELSQSQWKVEDDVLYDEVCALLPGPDGRVVALSGHAGYVFDPRKTSLRNDVLAGFVVSQAHLRVPVTSAYSVCDGVYSSELESLFLVDREAHDRGLMGVHVLPLDGSSHGFLDATLPTESHRLEPLPELGVFSEVEMWKDRLVWVQSIRYLDKSHKPGGPNDKGVELVSTPMTREGYPAYSRAQMTRPGDEILLTETCPRSPQHTAELVSVDWEGESVLVYGAEDTIKYYTLGDATREFSWQRLDPQPDTPEMDEVSFESLGSGLAFLDVAPHRDVVVASPHCLDETEKHNVLLLFPEQGQPLRIQQATLTLETPIPSNSILSMAIGTHHILVLQGEGDVIAYPFPGFPPPKSLSGLSLGVRASAIQWIPESKL